MCRCAVKGHGLVGSIGDGLMVGLDDLIGFSNVYDFVVC